MIVASGQGAFGLHQPKWIIRSDIYIIQSEKKHLLEIGGYFGHGATSGHVVTCFQVYQSSKNNSTIRTYLQLLDTL